MTCIILLGLRYDHYENEILPSDRFHERLACSQRRSLAKISLIASLLFRTLPDSRFYATTWLDGADGGRLICQCPAKRPGQLEIAVSQPLRRCPESRQLGCWWRHSVFLAPAQHTRRCRSTSCWRTNRFGRRTPDFSHELSSHPVN